VDGEEDVFGGLLLLASAVIQPAGQGWKFPFAVLPYNWSLQRSLCCLHTWMHVKCTMHGVVKAGGGGKRKRNL